MVEDDAMVAKAFIRSFNMAGHVTRWISTVEEAKKQLREGLLPDVLLLDKDVDGEDGWRLAEMARPTTRVVRMTGNPPPNAPPHYVKGTSLKVLHDMIAGDG